jgi:hypothetical protein
MQPEHTKSVATTEPEPEVVTVHPVPHVIVAVVLVPLATVSNDGVPPVESAEHIQEVPPLDFITSPFVQKLSAATPVRSESSV